MSALQFIVGFPPKHLHPNARPHWGTKAAATKRYRQECWAECKAAAFKVAGGWRAPADGPIPLRLDFHPTTNRARDDDNLVAAFKAGRDGIADALGVNDSRFQVLPTVHAHDKALPNPLKGNPFSTAGAYGWVIVRLGTDSQGERA